MGVRPLRRYDQRHPANKARWCPRLVDSAQSGPNLERQLDAAHGVRRWPGAVLGGRRHQVFPAGDGPVGMNRTGLFLEERTWNPEAKVFQTELSILPFGPCLGMKKLFQDAGFIEPAAGGGETGTNFRAPRLREALDQVADGSGFDFGDGHQLATTGTATLAATNLATLALFGLDGCVHYSIRQDLHQRQHLPQAGRPGRDGY